MPNLELIEEDTTVEVTIGLIPKPMEFLSDGMSTDVETFFRHLHAYADFKDHHINFDLKDIFMSAAVRTKFIHVSLKKIFITENTSTL